MLGYPVFEPLADANITKTLYCGPDAETPEGPWLRMALWCGRILSLDQQSRMAVSETGPHRQELLEGGILVKEEGGLRFTQDYLFSSPTAAAAVVLGYHVDGLKAWKDGDGTTLEKIKRS